jgi:hypothetical protein
MVDIGAEIVVFLVRRREGRGERGESRRLKVEGRMR